MSGWLVFTWALIATVILVGAGIFGVLVYSGKITPFGSAPTIAAAPKETSVLDKSYTVLVFDATGKKGLADSMKAEIVSVGYAPASVTAGDSGTRGFERTTVYYPSPADKLAAQGLADAIGGAPIAQSDEYPKPKQLTVVIGMDRVPGAATPTKTPTPSK